MSEVRETVGYMTCQYGGDIAEVRRDKKGKLYYQGIIGKVAPGHDKGQEIFENLTTFFNDDEMEEVNALPLRYGRRDIAGYLNGKKQQAANDDKPPASPPAKPKQPATLLG